MVLGLVLGVIFENSLRQALTLSHGSIGIFFTRRFRLSAVAMCVLAVVAPAIAKLIASRNEGKLPA